MEGNVQTLWERSLTHDHENKPDKVVRTEARLIADALQVRARGAGYALAMSVPIADEMKASLEPVLDFGPLRSPIRMIAIH
jgi:hypothetical protein